MKKEKIENIKTLEELVFLSQKLIENIGLQHIKILDDFFLTAREQSALKSREIHFFFTLSELNGKVYSILDKIKEYEEQIQNLYIVTSNRKISKYFKEWLEGSLSVSNIDYWSRDDLIDLVDQYYDVFWSHNDSFLSNYEDWFLDDLQEEVELKKLLKLDDKYDDFLNFFIEPKIFLFKEDSETNRPIKARVKTEVLTREGNFIISGEAGTGKSTLLKQIGRNLIENNRLEKKANIPVYLKASDLLDAEFSIWGAIINKLSRVLSAKEIEDKLPHYSLVLLIDSIDEFELTNRNLIMSELYKIKKKISQFYIGTRNYDALIDNCEVSEHQNPFILNFDQRQVKTYLDNFFRFDLSKSDALWEILSENNTLEKLPITPLTISLISILFEDKGYEVPATITDVYDNFSLFLLGRLSVSSRLDFLDINIKERILCTYALEVILSENRIKKTKAEFILFIKDFFARKSITIEDELVPELLKSLTDGTGILYVDDHEYVAFKHDHFMEYYASLEIFNHHRANHEETLISNFAEFNWQNTAIFYAGRTKDMPQFLAKVIEQCKTYNFLPNCLTAVSGLGYLLQSLWLTDSVVRKDGVLEALSLLIRANEEIQRLASSKFAFFTNLREPDIALMNLVWFYKHFNSLALKDPLQLSYESLNEQLSTMGDTVFLRDRRTMLFMMFCVAATLNNGRNSDERYLNRLFDENGILTMPLFVLLFETGLEALESLNSRELKEAYKLKNRIKRYLSGIKFYLNNPSEDLRFTTLSSFASIKKVKIYTEGKTDASIIEQAFTILTGGKDPYWQLSSCEDTLKSSSGGAHNLNKLLVKYGKEIENTYDKETIVIGIFDNDAKGCQEFSGLDNDAFNLIDARTKKHKDQNIFAIKLPIPPLTEYEPYLQEKQEFRFFEIEHYFPIDYLKSANMITNTSIPGVYEIKDKKSGFAEDVLSENDIGLFKNFIFLFQVLDSISNKVMSYID